MPNPDEQHVDAAEWMRGKLIQALGQAKLWPVRLASVRHQEKLSDLSGFTAHCLSHAVCWEFRQGAGVQDGVVQAFMHMRSKT